jgi:hypothetical protein
MLVYSATAPMAAALLQAANGSGTFQVRAYNNNQGALVVTAVDNVSIQQQSPNPPRPTAPPPPPQQELTLAVVSQALNVRAGPGGPVIGSLRAGTPVALAGCDASWCRLAMPFAGRVGWVSKQFLRF